VITDARDYILDVARLCRNLDLPAYRRTPRVEYKGGYRTSGINAMTVFGNDVQLRASIVTVWNELPRPSCD